MTYELILQSFRRIENGPARRVTVRYEAFQADFTRETRRLFQPCGLDAPLDVLAHPELFVISSSQPTKPRSVTNDPQALQILEKLCERMGYDFSDAPTDATANAT